MLYLIVKTVKKVLHKFDDLSNRAIVLSEESRKTIIRTRQVVSEFQDTQKTICEQTVRIADLADNNSIRVIGCVDDVCNRLKDTIQKTHETINNIDQTIIPASTTLMVNANTRLSDACEDVTNNVNNLKELASKTGQTLQRTAIGGLMVGLALAVIAVVGYTTDYFNLSDDEDETPPPPKKKNQMDPVPDREIGEVGKLQLTYSEIDVKSAYPTRQFDKSIVDWYKYCNHSWFNWMYANETELFEAYVNHLFKDRKKKFVCSSRETCAWMYCLALMMSTDPVISFNAWFDSIDGQDLAKTTYYKHFDFLEVLSYELNESDDCERKVEQVHEEMINPKPSTPDSTRKFEFCRTDDALVVIFTKFRWHCQVNSLEETDDSLVKFIEGYVNVEPELFIPAVNTSMIMPYYIGKFRDLQNQENTMAFKVRSAVNRTKERIGDTIGHVSQKIGLTSDDIARKTNEWQTTFNENASEFGAGVKEFGNDYSDVFKSLTFIDIMMSGGSMMVMLQFALEGWGLIAGHKSKVSQLASKMRGVVMLMAGTTFVYRYITGSTVSLDASANQMINKMIANGIDYEKDYVATVKVEPDVRILKREDDGSVSSWKLIIESGDEFMNHIVIKSGGIYRIHACKTKRIGTSDIVHIDTMPAIRSQIGAMWTRVGMSGGQVAAWSTISVLAFLIVGVLLYYLWPRNKKRAVVLKPGTAVKVVTTESEISESAVLEQPESSTVETVEVVPVVEINPSVDVNKKLEDASIQIALLQKQMQDYITTNDVKDQKLVDALKHVQDLQDKLVIAKDKPTPEVVPEIDNERTKKARSKKSYKWAKNKRRYQRLIDDPTLYLPDRIEYRDDQPSYYKNGYSLAGDGSNRYGDDVPREEEPDYSNDDGDYADWLDSFYADTKSGGHKMKHKHWHGYKEVDNEVKFFSLFTPEILKVRTQHNDLPKDNVAGILLVDVTNGQYVDLGSIPSVEDIKKLKQQKNAPAPKKTDEKKEEPKPSKTKAPKPATKIMAASEANEGWIKKEKKKDTISQKTKDKWASIPCKNQATDGKCTRPGCLFKHKREESMVPGNKISPVKIIDAAVRRLATKAGNSVCFAAQVGGEAFLVTCQHCITDDGEVDSPLVSGVIDIDNNNDSVTALHAEAKDFINMKKDRAALKMSSFRKDQVLQFGTFVSGKPVIIYSVEKDTDNLTYTVGNASLDEDGVTIIHTCSTVRGHSGSPILQDGKVVGIHCQGGETDSNGIVHNYGRLITDKEIATFFRK